ncbi:hypothetical protein [Vibrio sp. MA40-2]|uniref:hypothetical protein n=1 Tax=Vibrio sp. MA40-2 TaxID=3391828 RepID=UPI0039A664CD
MFNLLTLSSISLLPLGYSFESAHNLDVFTQVNTIAYAENNSAYHLAKGHEVDYKPAESAFAMGEYALGTRYDNFAISYIYRYEWFLGYTKDTMSFYEATLDNFSSIESDKVYDVDLKVNHINMQGIRFAYLHELNLHEFNQVNLYFAASYLQAKELMEGDLTGHVSQSQQCGNEFDCYTGELDLDYTYSEDALLDRVTDKPKSKYGYGFDIGLDWKINQDWFTSIYIQDIVSAIVWEQAPYTLMNATTSRTTVEDGEYHIDPVLTGWELNHDYKQVLPIKYHALVAYNVAPQHRVYLQGFHAYESTLAHVGYDFLSSNNVYRLKLYPFEEAVGIEFKHAMVNFAITTKPFDMEESELLEVRLGLNIPIM